MLTIDINTNPVFFPIVSLFNSFTLEDLRFKMVVDINNYKGVLVQIKY